jgi:hypothetical protein
MYSIKFNGKVDDKILESAKFETRTRLKLISNIFFVFSIIYLENNKIIHHCKTNIFSASLRI